MKYDQLKSNAESLAMPEEMKHRIVRNCKMQIMSERKDAIMKNNQKHTVFGRPAVVFFALTICLSLSVTALAATGALQGFFRNITNLSGTVVGTSYEQATEEINLQVDAVSDELTVLVTIDPQIMPYHETEKLGISAYQIVDEAGNVVKEGTADPVKLINGQAEIKIRLKDIGSDSYHLIVTALLSEKKADQTMLIHGNWDLAFTN